MPATSQLLTSLICSIISRYIGTVLISSTSTLKNQSGPTGLYHSEKFEAKKSEMLRERTESEEKLNLEITILRRDSDDICGDLSTSRAKCQKLEEALKFALQDADLSRGEAQDFHMRLNTSKKEVLRLGNLNLEAEKREKANYKRLEHLGGIEAELLKMRELYMASSVDLIFSGIARGSVMAESGCSS